MESMTKTTELSPVEALIVERTLGEEARRDAHFGTLARIQQLTAERRQLYAQSAAHPILGPANGPRIRELSGEIDPLWIVLRRERARRRVEIEGPLKGEPEEEGNKPPAPPTIPSVGGTDAALPTRKR